MRKILSAMVGALLLATTASPVVGASTTPVMMTDGSVRYGVALSQSPETDQFVMTNYDKVPVTVSYYDPTYGHQSVTLQPNYDSFVGCADEVYREIYAATVTFNPGAADAASGTAKYVSIYTGAYDVSIREAAVLQAKTVVAEKRIVLAKAQAQLRKARASLRQARAIMRQANESERTVLIKPAARRLKTVERRVAVAKRKVAVAKRGLEVAKSALDAASAELQKAVDEVAHRASRRVG